MLYFEEHDKFLPEFTARKSSFSKCLCILDQFSLSLSLFFSPSLSLSSLSLSLTPHTPHTHTPHTHTCTTNGYKKSRYRIIEFIIIIFSPKDLLWFLILHVILIFSYCSMYLFTCSTNMCSVSNPFFVLSVSIERLLGAKNSGSIV